MTNKIGEKIKKFREEKKISIHEMASNCGLHPHQLEMIEEGTLSPSMSTLVRIAHALGLRTGTLMDGEEAHAPAVQYNKKNVPTISTSNPNTDARNHLEFYGLAQGKSDRSMEPLLVDVNYLSPDKITPSQHEGEEFIYVLQGVALLQYGSESYTLEAGDSIYYDSFVPHLITTPAQGEIARVLAITYTPF